MSKHDPRTAEEYRKALLEETLRSLIRDPSRWPWRTLDEGGGLSRHDRAELRTRATPDGPPTCVGWLCDRPVRSGRYCSRACWLLTKRTREAFRSMLHQLRSGRTPNCEECGELVIGKRKDARFCSEHCERQQRYRRHRHQVVEQRLLQRRQNPSHCQGCGNEIPPTTRRRYGRITACDHRCYQRVYQRERYQRERAARQAVV